VNKVHWFSTGDNLQSPEELLKTALENVDEMHEVAIVWIDKGKSPQGIWSMFNANRALLSEYLKQDIF